LASPIRDDDAHQFGATLRGIASKHLGESLGNLKNLIENLVDESKNMAGRTDYVAYACASPRARSKLWSAIWKRRSGRLAGRTYRSGKPETFDATIRKTPGAMNTGDDLSLL